MSDEKRYIIRSFHSSVLYEYSPSAERFIFPLAVLNPKDTCKCGPPSRCAERKAGVDTMRVETTFLWMSDLYFKWGSFHNEPLTDFFNLTG
jgi:hypothetical protein